MFSKFIEMDAKDNVDDSESIASDESEEMTGNYIQNSKIIIFNLIEFNKNRGR